MLDGVGGAIGIHVQICQIFHAHVLQLRIFEQRDPHLSEVESHKQDSSDVPIKSNQDSMNRVIAGWSKEWSTTPNTSRPKRGIRESEHKAEKFSDLAFVGQETVHGIFVALRCIMLNGG
ncbi:uncharacterized protein TNCV_1518011 [Trichonephila clavipes]|nr:uncharacterized protein TNCV_1518011 [Trichonephila clavipes]